MSVYKILTIRTMIDVINARMEVREAGRRLGMNTRDQAFISLATSSLTDALGWGNVLGRCTITIEFLDEEKNKGLRVVCTFEYSNNDELVAGLTKGVRWMVDAIDVRYPAGDQVEVALTKWDAQGGHHDQKS